MKPLGVIADDFTGATDAAGLLVRLGADVGLVIGTGDEDRAFGRHARVHALKIRTLDSDQAVSQAKTVARDLIENGYEPYWKYCSTFDSTPRGNIGPVADTLLEITSLPFAVHCPAYPENGRTVYKGRLFAGDVPLDESPMRDHPLTPMRDASLVRLLEPQVKGKVGLITREVLRSGKAREHAERVAGAGCRHIIVDAIEDEDLDLIADAFRSAALLCGGSALAKAAADVPAGAAQALSAPAGPVMVLSGSCSAATRAQVAAWPGKMLTIDPDDLAVSGTRPAESWIRENVGAEPVLVSATASPQELEETQRRHGAAQSAQMVEAAMQRLAGAAFDAGVRGFIVAGGETSGSVTAGLEVSTLRVGREISAGVPLCVGARQGVPIALVLKSGNFGGPDFFMNAYKALQGAT